MFFQPFQGFLRLFFFFLQNAVSFHHFSEAVKARSLKLCFSFFKLYIVIPVWWPWPNFDVAGTWAFHQLSCLFGGLDLILTWQRQRRHKTARCNFLGSSHLIRFKLCVVFFLLRGWHRYTITHRHFLWLQHLIQLWHFIPVWDTEHFSACPEIEHWCFCCLFCKVLSNCEF